jgi:hypothetical protein
MIIFPGLWTAAPERITVGHKTRLLCQTGRMKATVVASSPVPRGITVNERGGCPTKMVTRSLSTPLCAAPYPISAFVAPKMENQVAGGGLCPLRRISTHRSTRQDAQINYLSTLSIFVKQTTYLATLPNPNLKANECHGF